jgi:hypothetical protein
MEKIIEIILEYGFKVAYENNYSFYMLFFSPEYNIKS